MMKGSGLEEALETVYGANAVSHMISGKAVSRALCGHFLVEAALVNKLMSAVLPHQQEEIVVENAEDEEGIGCESYGDNPTSHAIPFLGDKLNADNVKAISDLYDGIQAKSLTTRDIAESKEMLKLEECLLRYKSFLAEKSRNILSMWEL